MYLLQLPATASKKEFIAGSEVSSAQPEFLKALLDNYELTVSKLTIDPSVAQIVVEVGDHGRIVFLAGANGLSCQQVGNSPVLSMMNRDIQEALLSGLAMLPLQKGGTTSRNAANIYPYELKQVVEGPAKLNLIGGQVIIRFES